MRIDNEFLNKSWLQVRMLKVICGCPLSSPIKSQHPSRLCDSIYRQYSLTIPRNNIVELSPLAPNVVFTKGAHLVPPNPHFTAVVVITSFVPSLWCIQNTKNLIKKSRKKYTMFVKVICMLALVCLVSETLAKPTIYKRNEDNIYEPGELTI